VLLPFLYRDPKLHRRIALVIESGRVGIEVQAHAEIAPIEQVSQFLHYFVGIIFPEPFIVYLLRCLKTHPFTGLDLLGEQGRLLCQRGEIGVLGGFDTDGLALPVFFALWVP
jgi:hypothetical protein